MLLARCQTGLRNVCQHSNEGNDDAYGDKADPGCLNDFFHKDLADGKDFYGWAPVWQILFDQHAPVKLMVGFGSLWDLSSRSGDGADQLLRLL